jgi:lactoylglutathione lyase
MPKLAVIAVSVHDMDAAVDFYTQKLGFKIKSKDLAPQFIELVSDGPLLLLQKTEHPVDVDYPNGGGIILDFAVDSAQGEFDRLKAAGVRLLHDQVGQSPVGPYFAVQDPSGNVLELIQFDD